MKQILIFLITIFTCTTAFAQGQIRVAEASEVARVMDQYAATNRMNQMIPGWRIQLLATTDRGKMEKAREEFMGKYPFIALDFIHAAPYYKLRAGAFATKLESYRVLHQIKKDYPSAYPAQDKVRTGELIGFN